MIVTVCERQPIDDSSISNLLEYPPFSGILQHPFATDWIVKKVCQITSDDNYFFITIFVQIGLRGWMGSNGAELFPWLFDICLNIDNA